MRKVHLIIAALLVSCCNVALANQFNMPVGVTPTSHDIYSLHMTIFWICVAIGVGVFGVLIYSLIAHRKSKGAKPATFHESLSVEIAWTVVPFIILIAMAIPATRVLYFMEDDSQADINIKITGMQWKWKYEYLDEGISFYSNLSTTQDQIHNRAPKGKWYLIEVDKPLVVPIHKKIRFLVTSTDVIHSWWVPQFAVKRDAIPGFIHEAWTRIDKPGTYRGQCAELCGVGHGFMPIVVVAKTQSDYAKWVAVQRGEAVALMSAAQDVKELSKLDLMSKGKQVYLRVCGVCHKPDGKGMPPAFPSMVGSKITTGPVKGHIDIVLNGKKGTAMQAFGEQLSDEEIAAVITYERNSWGNDDKKAHGNSAGGLVQSKDVAKERE